MKQSHGKVNRKQSISTILIMGLIVLIFSVAICVLHVIDIKRCFSDVTKKSISENMQYTTEVVSATAEKDKQMLEDMGAMLNNSVYISAEEQIWSFIEQYNAMELYDRVYFVTAQGVVYGKNHIRDMVDEEFLEMHFAVHEPTIRIDKTRSMDNGDGVIYYLVPVYNKNAVAGYLLAVKEFNNNSTFKGEIYTELYKNGDLFLISEDGSIYAQMASMVGNRSSVESENNPNLFARLKTLCSETYFKNEIEKIAILCRSKERSISGTYINKENQTWCCEIRKIDGVEGLCLAYIFPQESYYKDVNEVVFKALLIAIVILGLTIAMIAYMWITSKLSNDMISSLAYDDAVTGGKNDKYFRDMANYTVFHANYNIPYILLRFDIVNFRYINEAYGHARADSLLKLVIEESAKIFYDKELCCRMTADQFLLLARNDNMFQTKYDDLTQILNEKAKDLGVKFPIRLKSGIYQIKKEDKDIGVGIDRANAARKTLTGDEKVTMATYSDKIIKQMFKDDKIESEMETAITNNEFKVFIQPKWNIAKDRIYGGEALVRWIKPDGSRVFPDEFIPVFERNGFVEKLDLYMLEEVCKYLRMLIDTGQRIYPVSVNQSRILMHNPEYLNMVSKILKQYRIPPGFVELEITETVFQGQRDVMISTVNSLKELDVLVSMDDFGSGYSSLNMLKDVPFDVIKIDREFFSESITSDSSILILRKIVEMAEGLGIRVLCEGVETAEQVELLKGLGVSFVQGYYYSKPISAEEYIKTYCKKKKDGKQYYDGLYEKAEAARQLRQKKREEAEEAAQIDAEDAVKQFKMSYKPKEVTENGSDDEQDVSESKAPKKMISVEEQKILARKAKNETE